MSKRFLISAIAVSVIAGVANAGNLTVPDSKKISVEVLKQKDLTNTTLTVAVDGNMTYVPTDIEAGSLSNPTLNIIFSEGGIAANTSGINLCEDNGSSGALPRILSFDHVDTAHNGLVLRAISNDVTMGNSKKYVLCNDNNVSFEEDGNTSITTLDLTGSDLTNPVKVTFKLYSGDSQQLRDSAEDNLYTKDYELCVGVKTTADASIDPSTGFVAFGANATTSGDFCSGSNTSTNLVKNDTIVIGVNDKRQDFVYHINDYNVTMDIKADKAIPVDTTNTTLTGSSGTTAYKDEVNGTNLVGRLGVTVPGSDSNTSESNATATWNIAVNGVDQIPHVNFTADLGIDVDRDKAADLDKKSNLDAGAWNYLGTTLNMPYVVANGDTQTAIRLTNAASVNSDVYWTCVDDEGRKVENLLVDSADQGHTYVPASGSAAWLSSDILKAAQDQNPDFAPNGKMKCSPLVTSTSGVTGVVIMTINGARDRVIPLTDTNLTK
jgi:hypothetical protein